MSTRLSKGGLRIKRGNPVAFHWNGRALTGFQGDTLASALLANGETLLGRSFKYHRPRGLVASGVLAGEVLALASAPRKWGGAGALLVLLKPRDAAAPASP